MKLQTAINRLNRNCESRQSKSYQIVNDLISGNGKSGQVFRNDNGGLGAIINPAYYSGSGKYTSLQDHTKNVTDLLDKINIKYIEGNNAPRGSATGNFILIKSKINR